MVGAGVAREAPAGRFVDGSKCVITTGINAVSESNAIGASKPALPAKQSNTKLRCQSISYGVRITVVDVGAGEQASPLSWRHVEAATWFRCARSLPN